MLTLVNWWWEAGVEPDEALVAALAKCLAAFGRYLGAGEIRLGAAVAGDVVMRRTAAQMS